MRSIISQAIWATGMSVKEFVEQRMGLYYIKFHYRLKHGSLRLEDYHKLCYFTGRTFEELFPSPIIDGEVPVAIISPPKVLTPKIKVESPKREKPIHVDISHKPEPPLIPPTKAFKFIDPFEDISLPLDD